MPINKEIETIVSTILLKETHQKLKKIAKNNKRSVSSQIAFYLENCIERNIKFNVDELHIKAADVVLAPCVVNHHTVDVHNNTSISPALGNLR